MNGVSRNRLRLATRLVLLALLPAVAAALWSYARCLPPGLWPVGVDDTGQRLVYRLSYWDPLRRPESADARTGDSLVVRGRNRVLRRSLPGFRSSLFALSSDQQLLAMCGAGGDVNVYDAESLRALRSVRVLPTDFRVNTLAFSRNSRYLAVGGVNTADLQRSPQVPARICHMIVDARTLAVTQRLGPEEFLSESSGAPYQLRFGKRSPGANGPSASIQLAEFEDGRLQVIASAPRLRVACSASLRFACDSSKSPRFSIWDRQTGTSKTLTVPRSHYPLFAPCGDTLAIISVTDLVTIVDPATAQVVRSWKMDGARAGQAVFSPDGRLLALATSVGEIEIWDVTTGTRRAKVSEAGRPWIVWSMAVLGTSLWCAAWLAIGRRDRHTLRVCRDVAIVSVVVAAGFFLRLVLGGYQAAPLRPAAMGTVTLLVGLSALVSVWLVFGRGRWMLRLSAAVAAQAAIWAVPVWVWSHFRLPANEIAPGGVAIAVVAALLLWWLRRRGLAIVPESAACEAAAPRRPLQWPLRDLLILPAALGAALVVGKLVPLPTGFSWWALRFDGLVALTQGLIVMLAVWVALSRRRGVIRWSIGLSGILLLSVAAPLMFFAAPLLPLWWYLVVQSAIGGYVLLCLLPLRRLGWRLRPTHGTT